MRLGCATIPPAASSRTDAKASGVQSVPWRRNTRRLCSRMESACSQRALRTVFAHHHRCSSARCSRAFREADRPGPGAGDGRGGLVSGHGTRTDFLRFGTTGSVFVLILPCAAVQVIGRWRRSGQESCRVAWRSFVWFMSEPDHIMVLHRGADADRALLSELMRG